MSEPPSVASKTAAPSPEGDPPSPVGIEGEGAPKGGGRSQALDAVRGLALLGVVLVNAEFFHRPFGVAAELFEGGTTLENWLRWSLEILVEGKAYPQLAFLFGAGLWLTLASRRRRGVASGQVRFFLLMRLVFLTVLGSLHVLLLWYGDILLAYVAIGCVLIWMLDWRPRHLVIAGLCVWMMGSVVGASFVALQALDPAASGRGAAVHSQRVEGVAAGVAGSVETEIDSDVEERPFSVFLEALMSGNVETPLDAIWIDSELRALQEGPFLDALAFRLINFALSAFSYAVAGIWQLLGIAMFGAAAASSGLLLAAPRGGGSRLTALSVGSLLLNALAWRFMHAESFLVQAAGQWLLMWAGPALAISYLAWGLRLFRADRVLPAALARLGRVSLSAYLLQSVVLAAVMSHWGLARAGRLNELSVLAIASGLFVLQLVLATLWLRVFNDGPLESIWRRLSPRSPAPSTEPVLRADAQ